MFRRRTFLAQRILHESLFKEVVVKGKSGDDVPGLCSGLVERSNEGK
jgi:hypothetical protein